jgi:hypothetical protein
VGILFAASAMGGFLLSLRGVACGRADGDQRRAHRRDGAGHLIEQRRIAAEGRELVLPEIEIAFGQLGEVGRFGHGVRFRFRGCETIAKGLGRFHLLRRGAEILALHNGAGILLCCAAAGGDGGDLHGRKNRG